MNKYVILFLFTILSMLVIGVGLFLCKRYIKETKIKTRNIIYFSFTLLTVFLHYLPLIYYAVLGKAVIRVNHYLPVYPCNVIMWQNLILCFFIFINKYQNKIFNFFAIALVLLGILCTFIGIAFNYNFLDTPSLANIDILCGLLSHVTLLFCCLYLIVMKYIRINGIKNILSAMSEGLLFFLCGLYSNAVIAAQGKASENSMFLQHPPFEKYPFINACTIFIAACLLYLVVLYIFEKITKPKDGVLYLYHLKKKEKEKL